MDSFVSITKFLDTYGVLGMFVIMTVAIWKRVLIPVWVMTERVQDLERQLHEANTRCIEIKAERDELLRYHFKGLRTFSRLVNSKDMPTRPGILPEEGDSAILPEGS